MSGLVWIIDDDSSIRWVLQKALGKAGFNSRSFENADLALESLRDTRPDVIVTDIRMPGTDGLDLLEILRTQTPDIPVIVVTAHGDLSSAVESYRGGAFEYLPKPFDVDEALRLVEHAANEGGRRDLSEDAISSSEDMIGEAPAMQDLFRAIGRLAKSDVNVLICGESGTGKELVARALHKHSMRSKRPLVSINTAAIPSELLESELFGHEKGAFTGAFQKRIGRFEQADGGTLFLDEIGDMPAELQTRLLRVLSDRTFYRVGGHSEVKVDVRIIAATHQDLDRRVESGAFREDLYHRINVIRLDLPPLRERRQDVPLLAERFLNHSGQDLKIEAKRLSAAAIERLKSFDWPGNVRQLENVCRWITVMAPSQQVGVEDLPEALQVPGVAATEAGDWTRQLKQLAEHKLRQGENDILQRLNRDFESTLLDAAMAHTGGLKQEAAKRLGWGRNTLARKLKEHNRT